MDLSKKTANDEVLERFAEEFCKHEELMRPGTATSKEEKAARGRALRALAAAVGSPHQEIHRQVQRFKNLCIHKMRWLVKVAQARYGTAADALLIAPEWLRRLDRPFDLMINALRTESAYDGNTSHSMRRARFTWELYASVRAALHEADTRDAPATQGGEARDAPATQGGEARDEPATQGGEACDEPATQGGDVATTQDGDAAPPHDADALRRSRAVADFAASMGLSGDIVLGIWTRMYDAALNKLRLSSRKGDLQNPSRPSPLEWHVIDLALLYDPHQIALAKESFSISMEVEALLQLYKLVVEAHGKLHGDKPDERTADTNQDERHAGTETPTDGANTQDPVPSCSTSEAAGDGVLQSQLTDAHAWESAEVWTMVHSEYTKRGRAASLVTLQRRWYELKVLTRRNLLLSFRDRGRKLHPLLLAIGKRFPHVVTAPLPSWRALVRARRVLVHEVAASAPRETTLTDVPNTVSISDVITDLLDWSDDEPEIIEPKRVVIEVDSDTEADRTGDTGDTGPTEQMPIHKIIKTEPKDDSDTNIPQANIDALDDAADIVKFGQSNDPTKQYSYRIGELITKSIINTMQTQDTPSTNRLNTLAVKSERTNSRVAPTQENTKSTDESMATQETNSGRSKLRIMFEDDDDLNEIDKFYADEDDLNSNDDDMTISHTVKSEKPSPAKRKSDSSANRKGRLKVKCDNIERVKRTNVNSAGGSSGRYSNIEEYTRTAFKRYLKENYYKKVRRDGFDGNTEDAVSSPDASSTEAALGESEASANSDSDQCSDDDGARHIDEKLLMLSRVVLTPVEELAEWRRLARGGSINCRQFSVRKFAAPPAVSARQLNECRRYERARHEPDGASPTADRSDASASRTGISRETREQLRRIPPEYKAVKKSVTRRLRLPRTYLSLGFWSSARNVAQLCACRPTAVRLERFSLRAVKRVELADIAEVRRINSTILTAQVAPITPITAEASTGDSDPSTSELSPEVSGGLPGAVELESVKDGAEAGAAELPSQLPSQQDLMNMIKTLVRPSMQAIRDNDAARRRRERREADALRRQRASARRLDDDIRRLLKPLATKLAKVPQKAKKAIPKKKPELDEDDRPLPDAYQEWQRQKTVVLKYFNFPARHTYGRAAHAQKQTRAGGPAASTVPPVINKTATKEIDLMTVSDDEDLPTIDDSTRKDRTDNGPKRPRSDDDSDDSNKRMKLFEDLPSNDDDATLKCPEEMYFDDDGDRMIIDEGIRDIDDSVPVNDPLLAADVQQTSPETPQLMAPVSSAPGSCTDRELSSSVYVVKTHKKVNVPKNADVIPTSSSSPMYYIIQPGKQIVGSTEFKVVSSLPLKPILPTIAPIPRIQNKNSTQCVQTLAQPKFILSPTKRPGPLSYKATFNRKICIPKAPVRSNEEVPQQKVVEEIDLTDDSEPSVDDKAGEDVRQKLFSMTSLTRVKEEKSSTSTNAPAPLTSNSNYDVIDTAAKMTISTVGTADTLRLEVGPIQTLANTRKWSDANAGTLPAPPESLAIKNEPTVDVTFSHMKNDPPTDKYNSPTDNNNPPTDKNNPPTDKSNLPVDKSNPPADINKKTTETICLDSESSNDNEVNVDCPAIKQEEEVNIDASSNESESGDVDVESEMPLHWNEAMAEVKTEATPLTNVISSKTKTQGRSLLKSSQIRAPAKTLPKPTSRSRDTNRSLLKTSQNKKPAVPKDTDNIPIKITSATTSRDLLKLSAEELARLLEDDDDCGEGGDRAEPPPQSAGPIPKIAPIQIKKEKKWTEEMELSTKREKIGAAGAVVKQEPGVSAELTESELLASAELVMQGVRTASVLRPALPDVVCDDVIPEDKGEAGFFSSINDFGRQQMNLDEYVARVADPEEPILKCDLTQPLWVIADKYLLLSDDDVPHAVPAHLSAARVPGVAPYTLLRFPQDVQHRQLLNVGIKKGRDVMVCGCGGRGTCPLCREIRGEDGKEPEFEIHKPKFKKVCRACGVDPKRERARIYTIKNRPYRKIGDTPLKYVVVDPGRVCRVCRDGVQFVARPDALLINDKHYEKIRDEPLLYALVMSVVQSATECARLARREAEMHLLNLRTARRRRLLYRADARCEAFNAAVLAAIAKMDREEVDDWYRRKMDKQD